MIRVSSIEGHSLWASVYDLGPNPLLALERRSMWNLIKSRHPAVIIDVACGTGQSLLHFQQDGTRIFGVDACEQMLSEAKKSPSLRSRLTLGEAESLPFREDSVNLVLCSMALGYFHDLDQVFREFKRVSLPGGCIAVSDVHPEAIAAGWTRSFKLGELRYEMYHYRRSLKEIEHFASHAGLCATFRQAVYFGDPEFSSFQRVGKEELFKQVRNIPALFIGLWSKPC